MDAMPATISAKAFLEQVGSYKSDDSKQEQFLRCIEANITSLCEELSQEGRKGELLIFLEDMIAGGIHNSRLRIIAADILSPLNLDCAIRALELALCQCGRDALPKLRERRRELVNRRESMSQGGSDGQQTPTRY
jgi:hypothetical protein